METESLSTISQHCYLFPFRIMPLDIKDKSIVRLKMVFDMLIKDGWVYEPYSPYDGVKNYNEFNYFHEYLRTALFEKRTQQELFYDKGDEKEPNFVSCLLSRPFTSGSFTLKIMERQEPYRLQLSGISLRLFETGIAILGFEVLNHTYSEFEDVSRINDFGRRVYPQFLAQGNDGLPDINAVKDSFLPESVKLEIDGSEYAEYFTLNDFFVPGNDHQHIARYIIDILGKNATGAFKIEPVIDDRMFTLCWYASNDFLKQQTEPKRRQYPFESSAEWYRFIFLDGTSCCCTDVRTLKALIDASTYRRWVPETLFGITRCSLMCLCNSNAPSFIQVHMSRQYRFMMEILLAQRASIIIFSSRISDLSHDIDRKVDFNRIASNVRKLHSDFIGFVSRLWFEEVTPQDQGIEMFSLAMKNMGLKDQIRELKEEMNVLNEYVEMQYSRLRADQDREQAKADREMNKGIYKLTLLAGFGVPLTILLSFWGMNFCFVDHKSGLHFLWTLGLAILIGISLWRWAKRKED